MSVDVGALDPHGEEFVRDRNALFDRLRRECPVAHSSAYGGFWILSRYADVRRALEDHCRCSNGFRRSPSTANGLPWPRRTATHVAGGTRTCCWTHP